MIKEALFTLIGSGVLTVCELQAQAVTTPMVTLKQPRFNLGVKAGFNSSMFFTDEISINGKELELAQNNYKVGYFAAVFIGIQSSRVDVDIRVELLDGYAVASGLQQLTDR